MEVQAKLGSDIALVFDECTPYHADREYTARSMERTHRWLGRCLEWHERDGPERQAVFGIVQGGVHEDLRRESAQAVSEPAVDGIAIGGTLGRDKEEMRGVLELTAPLLPERGAQAPARDRRRRRPAGRHRPRPRRLRLRDPDPPRPPRHRARPRPRRALPPRPPQVRLGGGPRAARRGLPLRRLHPPRPRLHLLPLAGRGADRRPPPLPPQPHLPAPPDGQRPQGHRIHHLLRVPSPHHVRRITVFSDRLRGLGIPPERLGARAGGMWRGGASAAMRGKDGPPST